MQHSSAHWYWMFIWSSAILLLSLVGYRYLHLDLIINLLLSINLATFLLYGLDKVQAIRKAFRVPERILWVSAFLGGSMGAILGMWMFRHKTSKTSFQVILWLLILLQIVIVAWWFNFFPEGWL